MAEQAISAEKAVFSNEPEVLQLSFDLYERYSVLRQIADRLLSLSEEPRVLDVGANSPYLWPGFSSLAKTFLPEARCTIADIEITDGLENAVAASGLELPFRDETFDLVCALDTLEHIPEESRIPFLGELVRVSRDIVYLTFPYNSTTNHWAEKVVSAYLKDVLESPVQQLKEHAEFGLPDLPSIDDFLHSRNLATSSFRHGNTDVWLAMMLATHTLRVRSIDTLFELNMRFNRDYAQADWRQPSYRASYVISKRGRKAELERAIEQLKPAGRPELDVTDASHLIGFFLNLSFHAQTVAYKDRHVQNLQRFLESKDQHIGNLQDSLQTTIRDKDQHIRNLQLQLAQIIEDKDRHIQNLEGQLSNLIEDKDRHIQNLDAEIARLNGEVSGLRAAISIGDLVHQEAASIRQALGRQEELHRSAQQQQQASVNALTQRIAAQEQLTTQLVTGRTWRTLQAFAKVAKIFLPSKQPQVAAATATAPSRREASPISSAHAKKEHVHFVCDEPLPNEKQPYNKRINVRGWALSPNELDHVEARIADLPRQIIPFGVPRPDVKANFPDLDKTGRSGFSGLVSTEALPNGVHTLELRLIGNGRAVRHMHVPVTIDHSFGYGSDYEQWIAEFERPADEVIALKLSTLKSRPLISIIIPVFNTDPTHLSAAVESVLAQSYSHWELCIADDHSAKAEMREILEGFSAANDKIKICLREHRGGISAALNSGLQMASGEFIAFLDHDDTLAPHALAHVVDAIECSPGADLIYSDEDKLNEAGERYEPFFKPEWSPDLLLSINYMCHLLVIRRDLVTRVGEFCPETDGSQDYDYILRASEHANRIVHIPQVLYHWRASPQSTAASLHNKPYTTEAARLALARYCERAGNQAAVEPAAIHGCWRIRYPISESDRVSVIIASGGNAQILRTNLDGLFTKTDYKHFEVLVVDNSKHNQIRDLVGEFAEAGNSVRYLDWRGKPFNYSQINNVAAKQCGSPLLLFLNDDISVIRSDWLTSMVELAARPDVGAVGGKLLFPDDRIQHAGIVMGIYNNCGHAFRGLDGRVPHYFRFSDMIRNVSAVTGACLMTKADIFWKVGGFDEHRLAVAFNDVDLCLRIGVSGYRVLFTPFALLYHHESFSKTKKDLIPHPKEVALMRSKWKEIIASDPYYSPNLTRDSEDYSLPKLKVSESA